MDKNHRDIKMQANNKKTAREQLDARFREMNRLKSATTPDRGWIHTIRTALGMTGVQLARRLKVEQSAVAQLEQRETSGDVTIKAIRKAAKVLDCTLVYILLPNKSLAAMVEEHAKKLAQERTKSVAHTMRLEEQELNASGQQNVLKEAIERYIRTTPKQMWDV